MDADSSDENMPCTTGFVTLERLLRNHRGTMERYGLTLRTPPTPDSPRSSAATFFNMVSAGDGLRQSTPPKYHTIDAILGLKSGQKKRAKTAEVESAGE